MVDTVIISESKLESMVMERLSQISSRDFAEVASKVLDTVVLLKDNKDPTSYENNYEIDKVTVDSFG